MKLPHQPDEEFPDPQDAEGDSFDEILAGTQDILSDPAIEIPPEIRSQIPGDAPLPDDESSMLPRPLLDDTDDFVATDVVDEDAADGLLDELATEFVDRYRNGERPTIADYAEKYPDLADEIRDLFPTIAQMEGLKIQADEEDRQAANDVNATHGPISGELKLTQLGDFRIIREIGRGGMGVVYEAEQTSLKRIVAVKVLPLLSLLKPELAQRFEREARTAAQLHHTNIVPVFGFGQFRGFHYYVMQLIEGIGLDELFNDRSDTEKRVSGVDDSSANAEEFHSVREATSVPGFDAAADDSATDSRPAVDSRVLAETLPEQQAARLDPADGAPVHSADATEIGSTTEAPPVSVTPLADRQNPLFGTKLDARAIADIGAQAASALAYAHAQGTLHRDIKPGNLLMDKSGQVWVADFGLAKAMEGDEITQSGNVVGTVRYMAPEQLRGENDPRSDVYSLGITLYELLTGRRAWSATERNSLIQQVLKSDLTPAGKLNPEVPRDLETIVEKATAKEPEHRYQTAGELETDLRRFLEDRPIAARPISNLERLIRWSRRNPVVASLSGTTAVLLLLVAVVGIVGYRAESAQRELTEKTADRAIAALDKIFDRFAPDQAVTLTGSTDGDSGPAIVSDETAALLEDLLAFYDQLDEVDVNDEDLAKKRADARKRVGDIRQRLGRHKESIASYRNSLTKYDRLVEQYPEEKPQLTIVQSRILNGIGTSQRMINQQDDANESHRQALETLETLSQDDLAEADAQFELARSYYLLAFRLRPGESPVDDDSSLVLPEDVLDGAPGPGGRPFGPQGNNRPRAQGPPGNSTSAHVDVPEDRAAHFRLAVQILTRLRNQSPDEPKFTHLLAICLREWYPSRIPHAEYPVPGQPWRPEELLQSLVERFPKTPAFRHALAETYAHFQFRPHELNEIDLFQVEFTLKNALASARILYTDQPTVPAYSRALIAIHFRLATVQRTIPRFLGPDRRDDSQILFSDAERNLRAAVNLQQPLVRRFPESLPYLLWQIRYRRSIGTLLQMQHRWEDSRDALKELLEVTRLKGRDFENTDSWHLAVSSVHRELSNSYRQLGEVERETEHELAAELEAARVRDRNLIQSRSFGPRRFPPREEPPRRDF